MEVSLTPFIDFVLKSGMPKMTCAKKIKAQQDEEYDPAGDYYKRFREAVQELHKSSLDKSKLSKLIGDLPPKKIENYKIMISGYNKFIGSKNVEWLEPPRKKWRHGNLQIPINPEVG